jgi:hypothetical protein
MSMPEPLLTSVKRPPGDCLKRRFVECESEPLLVRRYRSNNPSPSKSSSAALAREVIARQTSYAGRHLQRWPPGTPYPYMAKEMNTLLGSRELRG